MTKKYLNTELHSTRGIKFHPKRGLTGRVVTGEGFCKKAGMFYKFINYNKEGTPNLIEWISKEK